MTNNTINIVSSTEKALRIEVDGTETWIQRRWMRDDGTLTPKGLEAVQRAKSSIKKRPYVRVKYAEMRDISPKAVVVKCFNGDEAVLPKSQIIEELDYVFGGSILVPQWLADQKPLQFKHKQIWI